MDIQSNPFIRNDYWPSYNELNEINQRIDNVESDLVLNTASLQLSINNVSDNLNAYKDEQADTSISNNIIVNDINANYAKGKYGNFQNISSDNIVTNNLQVVRPITGATLTDAAVINPHITGGIIDDVSITNVNLGQFVELNDVNVKNLNVSDGFQVDDIYSSNVNSVNVNADFGNIKNLSSDNVDIVNASINNVSIDAADVVSLDVTSAVIGNIASDNIVSNNVDALNVKAEELTVNDFNAPVNAFIENLAFNTINGSGINALGVNADIISANHIIAGDLSLTNTLVINDISANVIASNSIDCYNERVQNLFARNVYSEDTSTNNLNVIGNAVIENLEVHNLALSQFEFDNVYLNNAFINIQEEPIMSPAVLGYDANGRIIPIRATYDIALPNNADYIYTDEHGTPYAGQALNNVYDGQSDLNELVTGHALVQGIQGTLDISNSIINDINNVKNDLNNVFINDIDSLNVNSVNVNYLNVNSTSEINFHSIHILNELTVDTNIATDRISANNVDVNLINSNELNVQNAIFKNGSFENVNITNSNIEQLDAINLNADNIKANNIVQNGKAVSTVKLISESDYNNLSDADRNSFYITYPSGNMYFCGLEFAPSFVPPTEYKAIVDYNGTGITDNIIQYATLLDNFDGYTKQHDYIDILNYQLNSFWDNTLLPNTDACIFSNETTFATNINVRFNSLNYEGSGIYQSFLYPPTSNLSLFNNLTSIKFKNCHNLNRVYIPQSVTNICGSFENCSNLQIVDNGIHDGIVNMSRAFYNTPKLNATFFIPDSVEDMSFAFYMHNASSSSNLNALSITGMNGVINASYAFAYSSTRIEAYCPDNVIDASGMYYNATTLNNTNIHIGNNVENASEMFRLCRYLNFNNTDLVIPENVRNAYYMFDTCGLYQLNQVYIYSNHFDNMDGIFNNCYNLNGKTIHIKSEIPLDESNYIYATLNNQTTASNTTLVPIILNDL